MSFLLTVNLNGTFWLSKTTQFYTFKVIFKCLFFHFQPYRSKICFFPMSFGSFPPEFWVFPWLRIFLSLSFFSKCRISKPVSWGWGNRTGYMPVQIPIKSLKTNLDFDRYCWLSKPYQKVKCIWPFRPHIK